MNQSGQSRCFDAIDQRVSVPIVPRYQVHVDEGAKRQIAELARKLNRDEPALSGSDHFSKRVTQGISKHNALIIGDQKELGLYAQHAIPALQYRMAMLAGPGDIVAVSQRDQAFEEYLQGSVGLRDVSFLEIGNSAQLATVQCRDDPAIFSHLSEALDRQGETMIVPYLCTGNTWRLGQKLAHHTKRHCQNRHSNS